MATATGSDPVIVRDGHKEGTQLPLELATDYLHDPGQVLAGELERQLRDSLDDVELQHSRVARARGWGETHQQTRLVVDDLSLGPRVGSLVVGGQDLHDGEANTGSVGVMDPD